MTARTAAHPVAQTLRRPPVPRPRFRIKTTPIMEALEDFLTLVQFRDTGGYLVAPQRWGKTMAARYLCSAVSKLFGPIPTVFVPLRKAIKPGANSFFKFLLTLARHRYAYSRSRTEVDLRNLFTECVTSRGRRSPHKMFILVIDEAQKLTFEQWGFLFEISNEADANGVNVLVLSVGQPALLDMEGKLLDNELEEISERFLQRRLRFRGLFSADELAFFLQGLETAPLSPKSEERYLDRFCPQAIQAGWRLSAEAPAFWKEFAAFYKEAGVEVVELPMTYVMNAINRFLTAVADIDAPELQIPAGLHRDCVRRSGVASSITSVKRRLKKLAEKAKEQPSETR